MSNSVSSLFSSGEITSIVNQLTSRIDAPISIEQAQVKSDTTQISALGAVRGALSSLNGTLSTLANPSSISSIKATVSVGTVATATASANASVGSYALTGVKLAKAQDIYSSSYTSASTKIGSGSGTLSFKFKSGSSSTISIPASADTVSGVAAAINKAGKGVSASVVNTASGVKLVFQSTKTGSSNGFSVSGTGAAAGLSYTASGTGTLTLGQAARNATFNLNGVPVSEASNGSIALVSGVKLGLQSSGSTTVSVQKTASNLSSALSSFTNKLNSAVQEIAKQTAYVAAPSSASASASSSKAAKTGPLLGNVQVQQIKQALLSSISSAAGSGVSANSLGFSISSGGSVTFSSSTFASAYSKNPTAVNNLIKTIESNVSNVVTGAIGTSSAAGSKSGSGSGSAGLSGFIGASVYDLKTTNKSLTAEIAQQTALGKQQISNLEAEFTNAINATSGSGNTLSYLSVLGGTSGKSTSSGG
jgi:flagellar hook-associated protein 2